MRRSDLNPEIVASIRDLLAARQAFEFELMAIRNFDTGLVYVEPVPAGPFSSLTTQFAEAFPDWPPYGGVFDEVVPHLSIGFDPPGRVLTDLRDRLPLRTHASQVTLTSWSEQEVETLVVFQLSPPPV